MRMSDAWIKWPVRPHSASSIPHWTSLQPRQLAEVRLHDRRRAAPDEKEQGFAAPAAGWMADNVAGPFAAAKHCLCRSQDEAVSASPQRFVRANFFAGGQCEQVLLNVRECSAELRWSASPNRGVVGFLPPSSRSQTMTSRWPMSMSVSRPSSRWPPLSSRFLPARPATTRGRAAHDRSESRRCGWRPIQ